MKKLLILMAAIGMMGFANCAKRQLALCGMRGTVLPMELRPDSAKNLGNNGLSYTTVKSTFVDTIPVRKLPQ